jgi:hypothetical protein
MELLAYKYMPIYKYTNIQIYKYTNIQIYKYTNKTRINKLKYVDYQIKILIIKIF